MVTLTIRSFFANILSQILYMDSIDLGGNNIPLGWYPRINWYEPRFLLDFTNNYEKCKGMKAKEAYLNRKVIALKEFSLVLLI